jgi:hypothetical protein
MQIDVLSQNTLKLTLSRLDMFDLDIKYESLSGKNPDTKRLLSHVLRTVRLDKSAGVDFSGERLFVEAFPRPDGGCMLYISCLEENAAKSAPCHEKASKIRQARQAPKITKAVSSDKSELLCRLDSVKELGGVCKSLFWQYNHDRINISSTLYSNGKEYRLLLRSNNKKLITAIVSEYGELLSAEEQLPFTCEHYNLLVPENAVEKMSELL